MLGFDRGFKGRRVAIERKCGAGENWLGATGRAIMNRNAAYAAWLRCFRKPHHDRANKHTNW